MVKDSGKPSANLKLVGGTSKPNVVDEVDALFKLPLAEFTDARNALSSRLKKEGRKDEAAQVKSRSKPSLSAWAVNQLYWNHREAFEGLIATGEQFQKAHKSRAAGKMADMRDSLDTRRESVARLADLAESLLQKAGHTPTPDTLRRVTTTLEAMSTYASLGAGPTPGRLTHDVDPPGFESLASLMTGAPLKLNELTRAHPASEPHHSAAKVLPRSASGREAVQARQLEKNRQEQITAARASLKAAKRSLTEIETKAQRLEGAKKRAEKEAKRAGVAAKEAEKQLRDAERRYETARIALEKADATSESIAAELAGVVKSVEDARQTVTKAAAQLESTFREPSAKQSG